MILSFKRHLNLILFNNNKKRNILDCSQSNVYSMHVIFLSLPPVAAFSFLSLYTVDRLVAYTGKICLQSPVICVSSDV